MQWLMHCTCDSEIKDELAEESEISVCADCGKRIAEGRSGSFTQWILRSDLCSCNSPIKLPPYNPAVAQSPLSQAEPEDETPELDVDPEKFPLDRFRPIAILGRGSFSVVYRAKDRLLNKVTAVKCLEDTSDTMILNFQKEARLNTQLSHQNIAEILDVGIVSGSTPFMVMELAQGQRLSDVILDSPPLARESLLEIMRSICAGVAYAHSKGILHRDLKPDNVIIQNEQSEEPTVKIIDFGFALMQETISRDGGESMIGSPPYMPPDQPRGEAYDEKSEIYALGCIFYFMFCGRPPFEGDTSLEVLAKHAQEPIPSILELRTDLENGEEIAAVIEKCLSKQKADRFSDVAELENAIIRLQVTSPSSTAQNITTARTDNQKSRWIISLLLLLSAASLLLVFLWTSINKSQRELEVKNEAIVPDTSSVDLTAKNHTTDEKKKPKFAEEKPGFYYATNPVLTTDEDLADFNPPNMVSLELKNTGITGEGFKYLRGMKIVSLNITASNVENRYLGYLRGIKKLRGLHAGDTDISTAGLKRMRGIRLRNLYLMHSTRIDDDSLETICRQFPEIEVLSVGSPRITSKGLRTLKNLRWLRSFKIRIDKLTDEDLETILQYPLTDLMVYNAAITDKTLDMIAAQSGLKKLSLRTCENVSQEAVLKLQRARPDMKVLYDHNAPISFDTLDYFKESVKNSSSSKDFFPYDD